MGQAALTLVAALLFAPPPPDSADAAQAGVSVAFRDCAANPVGRAVFLGALALELPTDSHDAQGVTEIAVSLACDGTAQIRIRVGAKSRERAVRFDDVPAEQRARALALVVAELFRSTARDPATSSAAAASAAAEPARPDASPTPAVEREPAASNANAKRAAVSPTPSAAEAEAPDAVEPPPEAGRGQERALRPVFGATVRISPDAVSRLWGIDAGVELPLLRGELEFLLSRSTLDRGSITSGVVAARLGKVPELVRKDSVSLGLGGSVGAGVTWTVGDSNVPRTIVREVLKPYADVRAEFALRVLLEPNIAPELMLYAGRAGGVAAEAADRVQQATGGWFAGARLGAVF